MGKVIHLELCKKLKSDHIIKWYIHNPTPALENESHKLLWDFEIQTDHLISTSPLDLVVVKKILKFTVLANDRVKLTESEMKDKYLDLAREMKKNYGT